MYPHQLGNSEQNPKVMVVHALHRHAPEHGSDQSAKTTRSGISERWHSLIDPEVVPQCSEKNEQIGYKQDGSALDQEPDVSIVDLVIVAEILGRLFHEGPDSDAGDKRPR